MSGFNRRVGNTVPSLLTAFVTRDPSLPLLTHYDDATGERTELSAATLANWVAKTANLLVDGCGLGPDDVAGVPLPPHWQTAAVLLGAWSAGLTVSFDEPGDVVFAAQEQLELKAADRFVLGFAPMGMPMRDVPPGWVDYIAEVRGFGDFYSGPGPTPQTPALPGLSHAALIEQSSPMPENTRVLIDADEHPSPRDWLVAPLAAGSSVVIVTHTDKARLDAKATSERATPVAP
jgi:uncharacterized protein (TIGR03089 family)